MLEYLCTKRVDSGTDIDIDIDLAAYNFYSACSSATASTVSLAPSSVADEPWLAIVDDQEDQEATPGATKPRDATTDREDLFLEDCFDTTTQEWYDPDYAEYGLMAEQRETVLGKVWEKRFDEEAGVLGRRWIAMLEREKRIMEDKTKHVKKDQVEALDYEKGSIGERQVSEQKRAFDAGMWAEDGERKAEETMKLTSVPRVDGPTLVS